jgi:hypothetical protein
MNRHQLVVGRAKNRCEYRRMHQSLQGATFHIEHVIPRSHGGSDDAQNLAWSCPSCNLHKSDRITVQLTGSNHQVALFNPRTDNWPDHFEWDDYQIIGRTEVGAATVDALDLNHERRLKIRQAEQLFGLFAPDNE